MLQLVGVVLVMNSVRDATYIESEQTNSLLSAKHGGFFVNILASAQTNDEKQQGRISFSVDAQSCMNRLDTEVEHVVDMLRSKWLQLTGHAALLKFLYCNIMMEAIKESEKDWDMT